MFSTKSYRCTEGKNLTQVDMKTKWLNSMFSSSIYETQLQTSSLLSGRLGGGGECWYALGSLEPGNTDNQSKENNACLGSDCVVIAPILLSWDILYQTPMTQYRRPKQDIKSKLKKRASSLLPLIPQHRKAELLSEESGVKDSRLGIGQRRFVV